MELHRTNSQEQGRRRRRTKDQRPMDFLGGHMTDTDEDRDDSLRELSRRLFGKEEPVDLAQPADAHPSHVVPSEGGNPGPHPIDDAAYTRRFVSDLFNRPESFYEQRL
ncbi:hypothetical protein [Mycobacterium sp. NPDC050041]|uniref:hypothetical protein n=1 Tax=Mycobacterium sp. NPDC050041 TaxID=3364293 RepID=UPI003C30921C